jgi:ATP-binding cassette, subfamily C (CFTR/MRP), member 1
VNSGKSSVLALLLRLLEPNIGDSSPTDTEKFKSAIIMDGVPLNQVDQSFLRERIIAESQDATFLPNGTSFRDNLDPWKAASDEECTAVLADLDLLDLVSAKGGLTSPFVPGELSSGQKQLLSFARAVLRRRVKLRATTDHVDGGLLLLDEVTSNTDSETERIVLRLLMEEFSKYTVLIVTHRRDMAMACDRVVVLDAGKILEVGRPDELWKRDQSRFRTLWS